MTLSDAAPNSMFPTLEEWDHQLSDLIHGTWSIADKHNVTDARLKQNRNEIAQEDEQAELVSQQMVGYDPPSEEKTDTRIMNNGKYIDVSAGISPEPNMLTTPHTYEKEVLFPAPNSLKSPHTKRTVHRSFGMSSISDGKRAGPSVIDTRHTSPRNTTLFRRADSMPVRHRPQRTADSIFHEVSPSSHSKTANRQRHKEHMNEQHTMYGRTFSLPPPSPPPHTSSTWTHDVSMGKQKKIEHTCLDGASRGMDHQSLRIKRGYSSQTFQDLKSDSRKQPHSSPAHIRTFPKNSETEYIKSTPVGPSNMQTLTIDTGSKPNEQHHPDNPSPQPAPIRIQRPISPRITEIPRTPTMRMRTPTVRLPPKGPTQIHRPGGVSATPTEQIHYDFDERKFDERRDEKTGEILQPVGPPIEVVDTRIDGETGIPVKSTLRQQSFTDLERKVNLTETSEKIERGNLMETRYSLNTLRRNMPETSRKLREPMTDPIARKSVRAQRSVNDTITNEQARYYNHPVSASPHRTTSHSYLDGRNDIDNKRWVSEVSLGGRYRIPPQKDGYSAKRVNEQRRMQNISRSDRQMESNRFGRASVSDFLEDISLEPIGAGVHDLDRPQGNVARLVRGNTPTGSRTPGYDQTDAFRTAGTTHMHREVHQFLGAASPMFAQHNSYQEQSSVRGMDRRFPGSMQSVPHGRASTVPPNYAGSMSGLNGFGNQSERETELMARVKATYLEWYLPHKSREAVESVLREMEPGSFIIRNSVSRPGSFALAIRAPDDISRTSDYSKFGPVKHFFITTVSSSDGRNDGVQLFGFENQAIFPNLASFVFHHCIHPCAFPCTLRLPANQSSLRAYGSLDRYRSQMSNGGDSGIRADMVYLGNHYVDRLEGEAAIRQAVSYVLRKAKDNQQGLPDRSDVTVDVRPQTGIQIAGRSRQGIVDIRIQPHKILHSAIDPENRIYADKGLRNRQMYHAKLFGIVVHSKHLLMHGKKVHVFAEFDPNQSAHTMIQYISNHFGR